MKKNILTIIIMALTVINVIMTAVMFFVMIPTFSKTNALITQVASVLHLELGTGDEEAEKYDQADVEETPYTFDNKETINLPVGSDGKTHYAMLEGFTLRVNTASKDYDDIKELLESQAGGIKDIVISVIASHPAEEQNQEVIKKEILDKIQEYFDSKCIIGVTLTGYMFS